MLILFVFHLGMGASADTGPARSVRATTRSLPVIGLVLNSRPKIGADVTTRN